VHMCLLQSIHLMGKGSKMIPRAALILLAVIAGKPGLAADSPTPEEIIASVLPAIVSIRSETPDGIATGTGFVVDSLGTVVTNLHVIEGASQVAVKLHTGEQYKQVRITSFDQDRDLAILRIPGFGLPTVKLGDSGDIKVGAKVFAIGNPLGLEESVSMGIVSSIRVRPDGTKVIQTDTAISPGSSGGPLIDDKGYVVGVVTFKIVGGENLNFAIPINYVRALLSFEQPMSLTDLAQELAKSKVSLFSESQNDSLTGNWTSLTNQTFTITLRQDGDFLYGKGRDSEGLHSIDLTKQSDETYIGISRYQFSSWYAAFGGRVDVVCDIEKETKISTFSNTRIEGKMLLSPVPKSKRGQIKWVKTCGESESKRKTWVNFTWVRSD